MLVIRLVGIILLAGSAAVAAILGAVHAFRVKGGRRVTAPTTGMMKVSGLVLLAATVIVIATLGAVVGFGRGSDKQVIAPTRESTSTAVSSGTTTAPWASATAVTPETKGTVQATSPSRTSVTPGGVDTPVASAGGGEVEGGLSLDQIRALVPQGWSLDDWQASKDGQYVVLTTTGPKRTGWGTWRVVNVYGSSEQGPVEVARWAALWSPDDVEPLKLLDTGSVLDPDESGGRLLSVGFFTKYSQSNRKASLAIDSAGRITVVRDGCPDDAPSAEATRVSDPLVPTDVTPSPLYGVTPQPSLTAPAGAIPTGWAVSQALWSDDSKRLAIVTVGNLNGWCLGISQLSIYSLEGGRLRELWREVNDFVTIEEDLAFKDVNGDGSFDVVYRTDAAGNGWTWHATLAATLAQDGAVRDLAFGLPTAASAPTGPIDLNGDGVYEWEALDASWELVCFCHACSPSSIFVLAWNGREYVDATNRYPEIVDNHRLQDAQSGAYAEKWRPFDIAAPPSGASQEDKDAYLSASVGRYLDYWNSARTSEANGILQALRAYKFFGELSAKRDWIVATLEPDPHDIAGSTNRLGQCPFP